MESFSLILGLIFVVLIAAAIAAVGAAIVFGVVRLWYLEEDFTKPKKAGVLTWVTLSAAIVAYIILFPRTETLEANQALMYARTTGDGFTVTRAEIVYDDGFAALFVEAELGKNPFSGKLEVGTHDVSMNMLRGAITMAHAPNGRH